MSKIRTQTMKHGLLLDKRDELIQLLLNEITFLDQCFYKTSGMESRETIKIALEKFENLLKVQGYMSGNLSDAEYKRYKSFVYETIRFALDTIRG